MPLTFQRETVSSVAHGGGGYPNTTQWRNNRSGGRLEDGSELNLGINISVLLLETVSGVPHGRGEGIQTQPSDVLQLL